MKKLAYCLFPILLTVAILGQSNEAKPDLAVILPRLRERVRHYYVDLQRLSWTSKMRKEGLKEDRTPGEKAQESTYDMILRLQEAAPDTTDIPFYIRELSRLQSEDGKSVKNAKLIESKAADVGLPLFLAFEGGRGDAYHYSYAGRAELDGRHTLILDVAYDIAGYFLVGRESDKLRAASRTAVPDKEKPPRVIWDGDSFAIIGLKSVSRVWIDANTYDLVQLEWRTQPFEFEKSKDQKIKFEVLKTTRLRPMTFENPKETFLVPEFTQSVTTVLSAKVNIPIRRITYSFADFRRFSGESKITPLGEVPQ